jgi:hypothetical protein
MAAIDEKINIDDLLKRADALIKEGKNFIVNEGKVVELSEWLSISGYAQKYNVTTQVVSKWIERGVIGEDNYIEIGKFGKKLVRDLPYKV